MPINAFVNQQSMPPWMEAMYRNLAEQSEAQRQEKYKPYPQKFMDIENYPKFGPDIERAFELSRGSIGEYEPYLKEAHEMIGRGTQRFPDKYSEYMRPYEEEIASLGKRAGRDYNENFLPSLASLFIGSGQETSSQYQKLAERGARNADENFQAQKAKLMRESQEHALKAFETDQARSLEGASSSGELAKQRQAAKLTDVAKLLEQGNMQHGHEVGKYNTQAQRYAEEREHPWNQINKQAAAVHGFPTPMAESGAQLRPGDPQMNTAGNLGSLAGSLYGASMKYGRKEGGFVSKKMNIPKLKSLKSMKDAKSKKPKKGLGKLSLMQGDIVRQPKVGGKHSLVKGRK